MHRGDHRAGVADPVQHGVAEHGVELLLERQRLGAPAPRIEAARARRADLLGAAVDGDDAAAGGDQLLGERAVAAAQIEHLLAGPRCEQVEDAGAEIGDKTRIPGIGVRIPVLCGHSVDLRCGTAYYERRLGVCIENAHSGPDRAAGSGVTDLVKEYVAPGEPGCSIPSFDGNRGSHTRSMRMSQTDGLNRRSFLRNAGLTALVGAVAPGSSLAAAAGAALVPAADSTKFDFDTPVQPHRHRFDQVGRPDQHRPHRQGSHRRRHGHRRHGFPRRAVDHPGAPGTDEA